MADPLSQLETAEHDSSRIENFLNEAVEVSGDEYFTSMTSHLVKAGGKRQRPRFTIAAAAAGSNTIEPMPDSVVKGGVAVELVQVGSLYHDDVLDEAEIRRKVDSVNARWGNVKAILAGDYLLAKASEIAAELGTEVVTLLAQTIAELCAGQVSEHQTLFDQNRTVDQYYKSIQGKTAALFATSTRIGGIVAQHSPEVIEQLSEFGRLYGLAFQIVDDILDVTATDERLGKPAGNDIMEGVYSLPVIYTLQSGGSELSKLLNENINKDQQQKALEIIRNGSGIKKAFEEAQEYATQAKAKILEVSDNASAQALAATADKLIKSLDK